MKPLSREFLVGRGSCCGNGCKECPYFPRAKKGSTNLFVVPDTVECYPSCSIKTMQDGLCMCYLNYIENKNKII
jgi:hypothetical protein